MGLQHELNKWADLTFGEARDEMRTIVRIQEEIVELLKSLTTLTMLGSDGIEEVCEECADIWIVFCRIATQRKIDIEAPFFGASVPEPGTASPVEIAAIVSHRVGSMLLEALSGENASNIRHTVAMLGSLIRALGSDPRSEVEKKMAINYSRKWQRDGTGHGYHTK